MRLISKYDFGRVKLPGLSRNGPLITLSFSLCEHCGRGYEPATVTFSELKFSCLAM